MRYLEDIRGLIEDGETNATVIARKVAENLPDTELRDTLAEVLIDTAHGEYNLYRKRQLSGNAATNVAEPMTPSPSSPKRSRKSRAKQSGGLFDTLTHYPGVVGNITFGDLTAEHCRKIANHFWGEAGTYKVQGDRYNALGAAILKAGAETARDLGEKKVRNIMNGATDEAA